MVYRIITQRKRLWKIRRICNRLFDAYTIYRADGCWRGVGEKTVVIEVDSIGLPYTDIRVKQAAEEIKETNRQECVLVQSFPAVGNLI